MNTDRRKDVDLLIEEFWKKGYLTVFRKYGTYLPEPSNIGDFEVDVIAKQKDRYAIGITLSDLDFKDSNFVKNKLSYLAQRQTRGNNKKVILFVGVAEYNFKYAKTLIDELDTDTKKNIKLCQISERTSLPGVVNNSQNKVLFS